MNKSEKDYNELLNQTEELQSLIAELSVYDYKDFSEQDWKAITKEVKVLTKMLNEILNYTEGEYDD